MQRHICTLGCFLGLVLGLLLLGCQAEQTPTVPGSATPDPPATRTEATPVAPTTTPPPWPGQDVQLLCQEGGAFHLWRYQPDDQTWHDESLAAFRSPNFAPLALVAVDAGQAVLVSGLYRENDAFRFQLYLWSAQQDRLIVDEADEYQLVANQARFSHPERQILYLTRVTDAAMPQSILYALDLEQCQVDDCALVPVDSLPLWSPDHKRTLIANLSTQTLALGDEAGQAVEQIGPGFAPFWLDAKTYGYLRPLAPTAGGQLPPAEVVVASANAPAGEAEVLLTTDRLQTLVETDPNWDRPLPTGLVLANAETAPGLPDHVFVAAIEPRTEGLGSVLYFDFDRTKVEARWILTVEKPVDLTLDFTRNGRYLVAASVTHLYLYQLDTGQLVQYPQVTRMGYTTHDWSADEAWLLVLEGDQLTLAAPDHDYRQTLTFAGQSCQSGVWVNR